MEITKYRSDLPDWVMENITLDCPYCGSLILDNSDTGVTTSRWCANPKCPGHMQYKVVELADFFKIKGIGPATARSMIKLNHFDTHLDAIPKWFGDKKPTVRLSDVAILACLEGYGATQATQELNHYANFTEYFNTCRDINPILMNHKEECLKAESYFQLLPPISRKQMWVMATGSFHGYRNRDEFFKGVNALYGQYVNVIQKGNSYHNISYLIKERDAADRSKSAKAAKHGIPVVTPDEFLMMLQTTYQIPLY